MLTGRTPFMPATNNLLTQTEQRKIYALPTLSATEITEYFTFNTAEIAALNQYANSEEALYFAISLAYFKLKKTFVDFTYRQTTLARRHVMQRYFSKKPFPLVLPTQRHTLLRIENQILKLCNYQRCQTTVREDIEQKPPTPAPRHPKQRALAKAPPNPRTQEHAATPPPPTPTTTTREVWQQEQQRPRERHKRHPTKAERGQTASLLRKNDRTHTTTALGQETQSPATNQLVTTVDQLESLALPFAVAKKVVPYLKLPKNTLYYYASLVDYYKGARLKQLQPDSAGLYLLCYIFIHCQVLNDQLLEALRKRTQEYQQKGSKEVDKQLVDFAEESKALRRKLSEMLLAIKRTKNKSNVPKKILFRYIPEDELVLASQLIMDEKFDPDTLFWQWIDKQASSIRLNLRPLFLTLDLVILRHPTLEAAVDYLQKLLRNEKVSTQLPDEIIGGLSDRVKPHLLVDGKLNAFRFEYWVYTQLAMQISSNKLTLKYTIKYKPIEDDAIPSKKWKQDKKALLKSVNYPTLSAKPKTILAELKAENQELYDIVNTEITSGENADVLVTRDSQRKIRWHLKPLEALAEPNDSLFAECPKASVVDAMRFVNGKIHYTEGFHSIVPRGAKHERDPNYMNAAILAHAIGMSIEEMGQVSDLNVNTLKSVASACIRMETITAAMQRIHTEMLKLPIFNAWNIEQQLHASIDGLKLSTQFLHHKARYSPKYFGYDTGVSSINLLLNHFPMTGMLIGANEYEGHFAFELSQFQHLANIKLDRLSTDKHGMNALNFILFYFIDMVFAPRIPKPHREILWGFGDLAQYKGNILRPKKHIDEALVIREWDNIQHLVTSMLVGETNPNIMVRKMSASRFRGDTKRALLQLNNIVKSNFILYSVHNKNFRHAIEQALNRGEAFNRLYRAISLLNKGELRGRTEVDMMVSDACTRLLATIILYYNSYILNALYTSTNDGEIKQALLRCSPTAWTHLNFLGHYQFEGEMAFNIERWLKTWDWKKVLEFVENP